MEFRDVLARRRMVRRHLPDPIDPALLDRIVSAGQRAPSAGNTRGQEFVVVTQPEGRRRIAELAGETDYVARGFEPWLSTAPALVVLCTSEDAYRRRYAEPDKGVSVDADWPVPWWWVDTGASLMAILLAAVDAGLSAGFLGAHAVPGLHTELALPAEVTPVGVITLGRPATDRRSSSLGRPKRDDVIHHERWQG